MNTFYTHGRVKCSVCKDINDCTFIQENNEAKNINENDWILNNNPSYWGSSTPKVLILGYSKGATQMQGDIVFDDIAFKGMRERLKEILVLLKLTTDDIDINKLFKKNNDDFGFASLIRCGISYQGKTSGNLITKSFTKEATKQVINNCVNTFLKDDLPQSIETIIFLGSAKEYKKKLSKSFEDEFKSYKYIDEDHFLLGKIKCFFVAHPSPANGHFKNWISNYIQ